ncbi:MAG: glycogen/starch/alpha-glucan phosphorylase [Oscillospiraceae bacterium]|nr:glycogen/starch/alpha-glucan phosphorylase [Oscillospiraceae bacterium]
MPNYDNSNCGGYKENNCGGYKEKLEHILHSLHSEDKSAKTLYNVISTAVMEDIVPHLTCMNNQKTGKRASYLSMEFLIGRMVYSNMFNLGLLEDTRKVFEHQGLDPNMFEQIEDCALGNGGLGRLAACFLDSAATHGIPLDGYGIRYRYGLFKQYFDKGFQNEIPDDWTSFGDPWSIRREEERVRIDFKNQSVWAVPYDMPVIGFCSGDSAPTINRLRLWQSEPIGGQEFDFEAFSNQDYSGAFRACNEAEAISCVLYPNDDSDDGKRLRLKQQYFFTSASLQSMIRDYKMSHSEKSESKPDFTAFAKNYAIQLNDTHPAVAVAELIRLLILENLTFAEAFEIARETLSYTNHTLLPEALEKWSVELFCSVMPEIYPYVVMVQNELRHTLFTKGLDEAEWEKYNIIEKDTIHMARMAIFGTHTTNGVAALHTELLKSTALNEWYQLYPKRFINKTNGITQRRWLGLCNPELSAFITEKIGNKWLIDLNELKKLEKFANDSAALKKLNDIKRAKKEQLSWHVKFHEYGVELDVDSIFDIQIKRLHEYKRQLLNAMSILDIYFGLKDGRINREDFAPMTFMFGAKAAPGYVRAKAIIKFLNEIAGLVNNDPEVGGKLKILFVQNYNVSYAEKLIPACDISEQISTAGTEASGTGNMKLMLNGAVTLGTYDGANVEIVEKAGEENNFIFGAKVEDIEKIADTYNPRELYENNPRIKRVLDTLIDGTFVDESGFFFKELHSAIIGPASYGNPDHYYLLLDFEDYVETKIKANRAYQNREEWAKMCLYNIANAGFFSSDRTIKEYANEIWKV